MNLVFTTETDQPIRDGNWRKRVWKPLLASVSSVPNETHFHDLRHTHVALCLDGGIDFKTIQTRLGQREHPHHVGCLRPPLYPLEDRAMDALDALAQHSMTRRTNKEKQGA